MFNFNTHLKHAALLLVLLALYCSNALATAAARVDRTDMSTNESLTLTLHSSAASRSGDPDLSKLKKDFRILGTSRNSRHVISTSGNESWTEWTISLAPTRSGELSIPSITVNGETTLPITISVSQPQTTSLDTTQPIFVQSTVDHHEVYLQQQILLTVRVFHSVQLDDLNLTEPEFDNALIKKVNQTSYQRVMNGNQYRVHELVYAIFPQQSGELTIPELIFSAIESYGRRSFFSSGSHIQRMTQQIAVKVLKPPAQATGSWLPATNLSIKDSWSSDPTSAKVGESMTRTITVEAESLLDSQLPELQLPNIDGAKLYADQSTGETKGDNGKVSSSRKISVAVIPTQSGKIVFPKIVIPWWDTKQNRLREAVLRATELTVSGTAASTSPSTNTTRPDVKTTRVDQPLITVGESDSWHRLIWPITSAVLALAFIGLALLYWRLRRQLQRQQLQQNATPQPTRQSATSEAEAFKQLNRNCLHGDTHALRGALMHWCQTFWPQSTATTLQAFAAQSGSQVFLENVSALEKNLYSDTGNAGAFKPITLLKAIETLRKQSKKKPAAQSQLASLY